MAYQEENDLHKNEFYKALCTPLDPSDEEDLEETAHSGDHTIFIKSSGMLEMSAYFDAVVSSLARGLSKALGPIDGYVFKGLQQRMALLREQNNRELGLSEESL